MGNEDGKSKRELAELQEENELLLQQLDQTQEALEHYYLLHAKARESARGAVEQLEPELASEQQRLEDDRAEALSAPNLAADLDYERQTRKRAEERRDAILASTSWRVSAPLRWLRLLFTGRKLNPSEPSPIAFSSFEKEQIARLAAERQIDELLRSTSWKVTGPLRWRPLTIGRLEQRLSVLERQLESANAEQQKAVVERDRLNQLNQRLRLEVARSREDLGGRDRKLAAERATGQRRVADLEQALTSEQKRVEEARAAVDRRVAELEQQLAARRQDLEEARAAADRRVAELAQQLAARPQDIEEARAAADRRVAELEQQLAARRQETEDARTEADRRVAEMQAATEKTKADLSVAIRIQALREADMRELQTRYASALEVRDLQHELLLKLRQRLVSASEHLNQIDAQTGSDEHHGLLRALTGDAAEAPAELEAREAQG